MGSQRFYGMDSHLRRVSGPSGSKKRTYFAGAELYVEVCGSHDRKIFQAEEGVAKGGLRHKEFNTTSKHPHMANGHPLPHKSPRNTTTATHSQVPIIAIPSLLASIITPSPPNNSLPPPR